jgi:hypothetical protein
LSALLGCCMYPPPPRKRVKVFEVKTLGLDFGVHTGLYEIEKPRLVAEA